MSYFSSEAYEMKKVVSGYLSDYKLPLDYLRSFFKLDGFDQSTIHQLTQQFAPAITPNFYEEIYALIPIEQHFYKKTFVLYKEYMMYVEMSPFEIIKKVLATSSSPLLNFEVYTRTLQCLFQSKTSIIPIATENFSLIPLGPVPSNKTIWVNPGQIENVKPYNLKALLITTNQFIIANDRLPRSITKRMKKGFLAHAILKREIDSRPIRLSMNWLEYLELPSTEMTREILRNSQFQQIPHLQGDFFRCYRETYDSLLKQNLFHLLDIEE